MAKRLALVLVLAVTGGCGADPFADKIKLRYMAWGSPEQMKLEEELCEQFNKENPDLHVKFFKVPGSAYGNKAVVMFASRTAPDVVRIDHYDFPRLVRKGYFYNLKPLADKDTEYKYADYYPQAIEEAEYEGGWYGGNTMFGAEIIYYNKTMVQKAGLEDPYERSKKGTWTWDVFREYAVKMTKAGASGRVLQFGCQIPPFPMETPVLWAFGGDLLNADQTRSRVGDPGTVKAYEFLAGLRWKDKCAPTPAQESNSGYTFEGGQIGMRLDWCGMTPRYRTVIKDFEWDICPLPVGPAGGTSMAKGNQIIVSKETKHPEAAWRFVKFLTSRQTETKLYVENRRNFPTRKDVAESKEFHGTTKPPFQTQAFIRAVTGARPLPIGPRWGEWTTAFKSHTDNIYSGRAKDIGAELRRAEADINKILADEEGF